MSFLSKLFGEKFETQSDLAEILSNEQKSDDWERAAGKLEDQYMILQVLTDSPLVEWVRPKAGMVHRYEDLYNSLAQKITDPVIAKKAVMQCPYLSDDSEKHFAQIIRNEKDIEFILLRWHFPIYYYKFFLEKIKDEDILLNLAKKAADRNIRLMAAEKLGNHDIIDALIEEYPDRSSLSKVQDPEVLRRIAQNKKLSDGIRFEAALLLKDDELIKSIAEKMIRRDPSNHHLLWGAIEELSDDILLWIISSQDRIESNTRRKAAEHIKDTSLLDDAAEQCENEEGRYWAYVSSPKYISIMNKYGIILSDLHSGELKVREKTADQLIALAEKDPEILLPIWDHLKKTIEEPVTDERINKHDLEEAGWYRYFGIGKQFPDKPAAKNGE